MATRSRLRGCRRGAGPPRCGCSGVLPDPDHARPARGRAQAVAAAGVMIGSGRLVQGWSRDGSTAAGSWSPSSRWVLQPICTAAVDIVGVVEQGRRDAAAARAGRRPVLTTARHRAPRGPRRPAVDRRAASRRSTSSTSSACSRPGRCWASGCGGSLHSACSRRGRGGSRWSSWARRSRSTSRGRPTPSRSSRTSSAIAVDVGPGGTATFWSTSTAPRRCGCSG